MANTPNIRRNVAESADNIYVNRWWTGLLTQRSPLFTPISALGLQIIARHDALADGLNAEISPTMTVIRRPGYSRFCAQQFGSSDYPLNFYSFKNLSGTIKTMVDTPTMVASFTTSAITSVFTKGTTSQTAFQRVGSMLYMCNGTDAKKWDGTTVSGWGIATPATAPTISFGAGSLSPTSGYQYVYCFKNSTTGHVSTASAPSASTLAQTSQNFTVSGASSADAQVDKISIFRTLDGGSLYYFLADVTNTPGWTYVDSTADSGLNTDIVAPISHANDIPPSGISLVKFHMGRMWVATGNNVYFAGGPDTTTGVPEEAFPPANVFKFPDAVTAMASTTNGLVVFTSADAYVILGTDTASFWSRVWQKNFGVQSQNCVAQDGDVLFLYTSKSQLFEVSDSLDEIGFGIGDKLLASFPPASCYLALHRSGNDAGLFISNGTDSIYRYSLGLAADPKPWSPVAQPVNGCRAIASIETSTATYTLLLGRAAGTSYILGRDLTTQQDDSTSYDAYSTVGTLIVAPPGDVSRLNNILLQMTSAGSYPTVSVLLNETSGTFVTLPNPVNDPPGFDTTQYASKSAVSKRHYFRAAGQPLPQQVQHLRVKVDFGTENFKNELMGLGLQ